MTDDQLASPAFFAVASGSRQRGGNAANRRSLSSKRGAHQPVEYLMNYLRPVMTKLRDGLGGKTFPRRVTAPDGSVRWQSVSGRSFATFDEATS